MATLFANLMIAAATLPASMPATRPTTRAAAALPLEAYAMSLAVWGALLAAGWLFFYATSAGRPARWSPLRCESRAESGPLWLGGGVMMWCFLAVPIIAARALVRGKAGDPIGDGTQMLLYTATYLSGLAAVTFMHAMWRRRAAARMLGLDTAPRPFPWVSALIAVAIAVPLTNVASTLTALLWQTLRMEREPSHALLQLMDRNESTPWVLIAALVNATVLAPIFEELLFRGHLQTAIAGSLPRRWKGGTRWPAIIITSALFAAIHEPWTMPPIFVLSVAIGVVYEWTGSLWVAMAMHVAFNATSTVMFLALRG